MKLQIPKELKTTNLYSLNYEEACEHYALIDKTIKELTAQADLLKARIKSETMVSGEGPEWIVDTPTATLEVIRRESHGPDRTKLLELLKEKKLDPSLVLEKVTSEEISPSKIDHLIQLGHLTMSEVNACKKVSIALYCEKK